MEYSVDCSGWSKEQLLEVLMTFSKQENVKIVLYREEDKVEYPREELVGKYLNSLGVPRHLNGYSYLKYSIVRCLCYPEELESVTKILYPAIARKFGTTSGSVEHGIRHAIKKTCENYKNVRTTEWENVFGKNYSCSYKKPTNSQFIAALTDYINLNKRGI